MLSFIHSFTHSIIHSFIHSFTHSIIHSLIHSFIHSFNHSFIHSVSQSVSQSASQPVSQSFTHYRHRIIASKKFAYCHMKIKNLEIHFILKNIIIIKNRNNQLLERTEYGQIYEDILCILQYRSTQIHILC